MNEDNKEFLNEKKRICIVSHGITLGALFHYILGFDDKYIWRFALHNTSISEFIFDKRGWFIVKINDAAHLVNIGKLKATHAEKYDIEQKS